MNEWPQLPCKGMLNSGFSLIIPTFDSVQSAQRAKASLNGADIYSGCCTLKIEYAKVRGALFYLDIFRVHIHTDSVHLFKAEWT